MSLIDNIRRRFALTGSAPAFEKDEPRSYGDGVIKRIALSKGGTSFQQKKYEPHIGRPRTYMNVYLADPIVRSLIDLPCFYAVKDNYDIVTADDSLRETIETMFRDINIENILYGWLRNARVFGNGYLEWTGDNLIVRSSQNMFVKRDKHRQIEYYYQDLGDNKDSIYFEEDEIEELWYPNQFIMMVSNANEKKSGLACF